MDAILQVGTLHLDGRPREYSRKCVCVLERERERCFQRKFQRERSEFAQNAS